MPEKLLIMLLNCSPDRPSQLGAPFFQATAAAAMDIEAEMVLTSDAGLLMVKGVAEELYVKEGSGKSVYGFIQDAHEAGVRMYVCTPSLALHEIDRDDFIPECDGVIGGAAYVDKVMSGEYQVLTY